MPDRCYFRRLSFGLSRGVSDAVHGRAGVRGESPTNWESDIELPKSDYQYLSSYGISQYSDSMTSLM